MSTLPKMLQYHRIAAVAHGFRSSFRDWAAEQTDHPRDVISWFRHFRKRATPEAGGRARQTLLPGKPHYLQQPVRAGRDHSRHIRPRAAGDRTEQEEIPEAQAALLAGDRPLQPVVGPADPLLKAVQLRDGLVDPRDRLLGPVGGGDHPLVETLHQLQRFVNTGQLAARAPIVVPPSRARSIPSPLRDALHHLADRLRDPDDLALQPGDLLLRHRRLMDGYMDAYLDDARGQMVALRRRLSPTRPDTRAEATIDGTLERHLSSWRRAAHYVSSRLWPQVLHDVCPPHRGVTVEQARESAAGEIAPRLKLAAEWPLRRGGVHSIPAKASLREG